MKVGTATAAGPAYVVNGDGTSCYGETSGAAERAVGRLRRLPRTRPTRR